MVYVVFIYTDRLRISYHLILRFRSVIVAVALLYFSGRKLEK